MIGLAVWECATHVDITHHKAQGLNIVVNLNILIRSQWVEGTWFLHSLLNSGRDLTATPKWRNVTPTCKSAKIPQTLGNFL
jgi:hypothetical protein